MFLLLRFQAFFNQEIQSSDPTVNLSLRKKSYLDLLSSSYYPRVSILSVCLLLEVGIHIASLKKQN